jgi:RNA polymerase sigma-70 factor, ECF subfamily
MNAHDRFENEILVLRCQEGDIGAFENLVGCWQERLWRHAWRLTGEENAAWDALQEAWIGINRGLPRLAEPAAFPAWAFQIVGHKCRDWLRRHRRQRQLDELYGSEIQESYEAAEEPPQYANLKEALGQLSGPDRAIIALRYEECFGTAAIAAILGISEGTVKSRLFYARKRLRHFLENLENTDE